MSRLLYTITLTNAHTLTQTRNNKHTSTQTRIHFSLGPWLLKWIIGQQTSYDEYIWPDVEWLWWCQKSNTQAAIDCCAQATGACLSDAIKRFATTRALLLNCSNNNNNKNCWTANKRRRSSSWMWTWIGHHLNKLWVWQISEIELLSIGQKFIIYYLLNLILN